MRSSVSYLAAVGLSTLAHSAALAWVWWGQHDFPLEPVPALADPWIGNTIEISTEAVGNTEVERAPAVPGTETRSRTGLGAGSSSGGRPLGIGKSEPTTEPRAARLGIDQPRPVRKSRIGPSAGSLRLPPKASSQREEPMHQSKEGSSRAVADAKKIGPSDLGSACSDRGQDTLLERAMAEAAAQDGARAAGTYGSVGVDPRERDLMRALARALPVSLRAASRWWTRPEGVLGRIRFDVILDDEGHIREMRTPDPSLSSWMKAVVERLGWLLRAGRFSLSATGGSHGTERFEMLLSLSQSGAPEDFGHRGDIVEMGFDAPTGPGAPAKSWIRESGGGRLLGKLTRIGEASGETE